MYQTTRDPPDIIPHSEHPGIPFTHSKYSLEVMATRKAQKKEALE